MKFKLRSYSMQLRAVLTILILIINSKNVLSKDSNNGMMLFGNKGEFNIGFKRYFIFDSTRDYQLLYDLNGNQDSTKYPRPMIINVWYPTKDKPKRKFPYANYISYPSKDPLWSIFLKHIHDYNFNTIKNNAFRGSQYKNDTVNADKDFLALMDLDCGVAENAEYANGEFPLIIYQQSLGGTIEENAVLCQLLASNGFLVINCAYQSNQSTKVYADWNLERAEKDVLFLLHFAERNLPSEKDNYHLLGFSFGAQSNFNLLTKPYKFKSMVSFDSRLEYYFNINPRGHKDLPKTLLSNTEKINVPLLLFTNQFAPYTIIDSLSHSDRIYAMAKGFNHYDFTSQKQLSNELFCQKTPNIKLAQQQIIYSEICKNTISFLKAKSSKTNTSFLFERSDNFLIEIMALGKSKPDLNLGTINTPRQALLAIEVYGLEKIQTLFPNHRISFDEDILNDFAYSLVIKENISMAREVLIWSTHLFPESANLFDSLGEIYFLEKDFTNSLNSYQRSVNLNPKNQNAISYIQKISKLIENK
ncbi:MAG: hypothetical protein QM530_09685 [Phycisphaerales bacterium]|nr:hypothetical protein [Phycisphaerales bacterium]